MTEPIAQAAPASGSTPSQAGRSPKPGANRRPGLSLPPASRRTALDCTGYFAKHADAIDAPSGNGRVGLRFLGERGLLDLGAGADGGTALRTGFELIERIASECLSSAFSLWAHRMTIEYLARGRTCALTESLADGLRAGHLAGSTAMGAALRDLAGFEPPPVLAEAAGDHVRLSGRITWASNLFTDAVIVVPARTADGGRIVAAFRADAPGVGITPPATLMALNATCSSSVKLDGVEIPSEAVLSHELPDFVEAFRPTFLLLQSGFCTGVASRCISEAAAHLDAADSALAAQVEHQQTTLDRLRVTALRLLDDVRAGSRRELLQLRLDAGRLAVAAARLELTVVGGAGYIASSHTNRRLRETAFLPIQSPTEGHLLWELQQQP